MMLKWLLFFHDNSFKYVHNCNHIHKRIQFTSRCRIYYYFMIKYIFYLNFYIGNINGDDSI